MENNIPELLFTSSNGAQGRLCRHLLRKANHVTFLRVDCL